MKPGIWRVLDLGGREVLIVFFVRVEVFIGPRGQVEKLPTRLLSIEELLLELFERIIGQVQEGKHDLLVVRPEL